MEAKRPKTNLEKLCDDIINNKKNNTLENMIINFRMKNNNVEELKEAFT